MPNRDATRGPAILTLLSVLALVIVSTGCRVSVEEPQGGPETIQRTALATSITPLPQYDVAISAIDFDPPIGRGSLLSVQPPTKLVAAIENKGAKALDRLQIEARVTDRKGNLSLQDQVSLDKLSPGETKVVEFRKVSSLDSLSKPTSFRVKVSVDGPQLDPTLPKPSRELVVTVADQ